MFRNPIAHDPQTNRSVTDEELLELLMVLSMIHRRLDGDRSALIRARPWCSAASATWNAALGVSCSYAWECLVPARPGIGEHECACAPITSSRIDTGGVSSIRRPGGRNCRLNSPSAN